jgi:hypothetical protein
LSAPGTHCFATADIAPSAPMIMRARNVTVD